MTFDPKTDAKVTLVEPLKIIKEFPDEFWAKSSTFNEIYKNDYLWGKYNYTNPCSHSPQSYKDFPVWKTFDQQVLKILQNKEFQYLGGGTLTPHYIVLTIGKFYFRCNEGLGEVEVYIPTGDKWCTLYSTLSYTSPKELKNFIKTAQKSYKKIDSTWNTYRRNALRRLKLLKSSGRANLKVSQKRVDAILEARKAVLSHIDSLRKTLQGYKRQVIYCTIDLEATQVVFDAINEMISVNGDLKDAMGVFLENKKNLVICPTCGPTCREKTAVIQKVKGKKHFLCFRCGNHLEE